MASTKGTGKIKTKHSFCYEKGKCSLSMFNIPIYQGTIQNY